MDNLMQLQKMASSVERFVDEKMTDPQGRVYSQIDGETLERINEHTFRGGIPEGNSDWCLPGFNRVEFGEYENVGMVTGAYLLSLVQEYKNQPSSQLLEKIRFIAGGLLYIAEIGREWEWGFFPKCYGGRFSLQTSTDQYLTAISGLDLAYEYLPKEMQTKIDSFMVAAVEFWRKRDYRLTYYTTKDMKWPELRFPTLLYLAAKYSGDSQYTKEADALTEKNLAFIPENSKLRERELSEDEKRYGLRMVWGYPDSCSMDTLNADLVLRVAPGSKFEETWRKSMLTIWDEGKRVITKDGDAYNQMSIDLKTGEYRPGDSSLSPDWHGCRTGWSTMITRGGLLAAVWNPERRQEILKETKEILGHFTDVRQFNYMEPKDAEQLAPRYRFKTRFLSGDAVSNYLWSVRLIEALEKA